MQLKRVFPQGADHGKYAALIAVSCAVALFVGAISSWTRGLGDLLSCLICLPVAALLYFVALRLTGYMPKPALLIGYIRK